MRSDGEDVTMTLRLRWRACGVVWARRLGQRGEDQRVDVGERGMRVRVEMLLRAVVRPLLFVVGARRGAAVWVV